jgi:hypothetical protein
MVRLMALGITKQELANGRRLSVLPSNELLKWIVVRGRVWLRSTPPNKNADAKWFG